MSENAVRSGALRIFVTDCEGPITKNDNAFELTTYFIPKGSHFFTLLSRYDDVLADVIQKHGYKAGDTLKLILPFLKTYGATNQKILEYSAKNLLLLPGARDTLQFMMDLMPAFIVSTSYEPYIASLCHFTGFPEDNVYCTQLNIDRYELNSGEVKKLKKLREEICSMSMLEIPNKAHSLADFTPTDQSTLQRLNEIFWEELPTMDANILIRETNPIGGPEKARAVQDILEKHASQLDKVMFIGDSITDVPPFSLVKKGGGLTVSFNGNEYAVREAQIAVLSENTLVTSILAEIFHRYGRDRLIELVDNWKFKQLQKYHLPPILQKRVERLYPERLPQVERITSKNVERLTTESTTYRKHVRGEAIGRLG